MMKSAILCIFLSLMSVLDIYADNSVSISASDGKPGELVDVSVSVKNTSEVVAEEFHIPLNENLSYVENSFTYVEDRFSGHSVSCSFSNGSLNIYVYGRSLTALPDGDGKAFSFKVKLSSVPGHYSLSPTALFSDAAGNREGCQITGTSITILAPQLAVSTDSIGFGRVAIRGSYSKSVILQNTGTDVLNISSILPSNSVFSVSSAPTVIPAGEKRELCIDYKPVKHGGDYCTMKILSDAVNGDKTVKISADAYSVNELHVGSASGDFGTEVTVGLSVNNMECLTAVQCSFNLPEQLQFVKGSFTTAAHANGMEAVESYTGNRLTLYLYSNSKDKYIAEGDGNIATFRLFIAGTSGTYALNPENIVLGNTSLANMVSASTAGFVAVSSPMISCDTVITISPASIKSIPTKSFTIKNSGSAVMTVSKIVFADEGYAIAENLPVSIRAGRSYSFTLSYSPSTMGDYSTRMQIYSDDPTSRMTTVKVNGSIYEPNTLWMLKSFSQDGKECTVSVGMENYSDISAVQLNINGLGRLKTSGSDMRLSDRCKNMRYLLTDKGGGSYLVALYSLDKTQISGHGGLLFSVCFKGEEAVAVRDISLSDILLSNDGGGNMASEKMTSDSRQLINITLNADGRLIDQTRVVFNDEKSLSYEADCDAAKMTMTTSETVGYVYSYDAEGNHYSINERPLDSGVVPLTVVALKDVSASINVSRMDATVTLFDKQENVEHDFSDGPYNVTLSAGTYDKRFEIHALSTKSSIVGDVNEDGVVDVVDVACLVSYLNGDKSAVKDETAADVDGKDGITIEDVSALRHIVMLSDN